MNNRLSCLVTAYNEVDFIEYSLRAALPYVDDLCVIEGSYIESQNVGASPRSNDGTIEIINKIMKERLDNKVKDWPKMYYYEVNLQTDKDHRNFGLEKIKQLNPDGWLLIIDGDEVYTKENFLMVRNFMRTMELQQKYAAYFQSYTFINDLEHFTIQEFPRLFKITPECQFVNDNFMVWPDKGLGWAYPHVIKLPYLHYHHYAFCKKDRFKLKSDWWNTRFNDKNFEYDWYQDENGQFYSPNHQIQLYTGKHPEIMRNHPLYPKEAPCII